MTQKTCKVCNKEMSEEHFQRNHLAPGGRNAICNRCVTSKYEGTSGNRGGKYSIGSTMNKVSRGKEHQKMLTERDLKTLEMKLKLLNLGLIDTID